MDASTFKGKKGLRRIINAAGYSVNGFRIAWKHEAAFREELLLCLVLVPVALWLDVSVLERIALVGSLGLLLVVELLNTAIENAIDRIGPEHHKLSGRAKDLGSSAVFVMLMLAGFVWVSILWAH